MNLFTNTKFLLTLFLVEEVNKKQRNGWIVVSLGVFAIVFVGTWFFLDKYARNSPFPKNISQQLKIKLYYPYNMPARYSVDRESFQTAEGNGLIFNILNSKGESIGVTEQPLPPNLDLYAPDPGGVKPEVFPTPLGQATIRPAADKRIGYIVAGKTFIVFNLGNTPSTDFQAIARSFK